MNSVYLGWPCGLQIWLRLEAFLKQYSQLITCGKPFTDIFAAFLELAYGQVGQLCGGDLWREWPALLGEFEGHPVQTLNRVRCVDDPADYLISGEAVRNMKK